jgi:gamma-glutamyl:cysteine ligase YbdK (ATP-grasp superfamily)
MSEYSLFEVFGVEMEFMVVDRNSLNVRPVVDRLIEAKLGAPESDVENGVIDWSNELVNHVVELKYHEPYASLALGADFHQNVQEINQRLESLDAMLLPTGAHPWMDPNTETQLWPHEHSQIYRLYNRIFDCRGHGWSNLQSTHLNLPFSGDEEFGKLHAAIRVILPLLPALSASTPFLDGRATGVLDSRLDVYRTNQKRFPVITGLVVPEPVFTKADYHLQIFDPIREVIAPYDEERILDQHFLNSRGAIARFDRGAIEIRVLDLQECPQVDLAILEATVRVLRKLVAQDDLMERIRSFPTARLADLLLRVIESGRQASVEWPELNEVLGVEASATTVGALWEGALRGEPFSPEVSSCLSRLQEHGSLSERILRRLPPDPPREALVEVYRELAACLQRNEMLS